MEILGDVAAVDHTKYVRRIVIGTQQLHIDPTFIQLLYDILYVLQPYVNQTVSRKARTSVMYISFYQFLG
jgi:hypothetical protein